MSLTKLDKKIIYELDINSRQKLSILAKKLKTSEQRIKYRIEMLKKNKVIIDFISVINITKLGLYPFRVYFRYNNVDPEKEKEILDYLIKSPSTQWIGNFSSGRWDLEIVIFAKNFFHYNDIMNEIMEKYGKYIRTRSLSVSINNYYFKRRYLCDKSPKINPKNINSYGGEPKNYSIDKKDIEILSILAKDSRASLVDISKKINITPNSVKYRIKAMEQKGILQTYTLVLNTYKMGYEFYKILINLSGLNKKIESKIASFCEKFPNIWFFIKCDGAWNVEFEVEIKKNSELREILREFRREFNELVLNYETLLVYKISKMTYFPKHIRLKPKVI